MAYARTQTIVDLAAGEYDSPQRRFQVGRVPPPETRAAEQVPTTARDRVHKSVVVDVGLRRQPQPLPGDENYFKVIKAWEGVVEEVGANTFFATMRDRSEANDRGKQVFEIEIEDVPEGDRTLIVEGGIFFLTVGYDISRGGQRTKGARVVFRRMPRWSRRDIERAREREVELGNILERHLRT
jgi:hypothetical protein